MVDECIDFFRFIGMHHKAGTLIEQQDVLVLVDNVQAWLEQRKEHIFLAGLVKKLVIDV